MNTFKKINLLGVGFTEADKDKILEYITRSLVYGAKKSYIVTPNPELLVMADKDVEYKKVLNEAELALPDGIGVILASKILGKHLKQRIPGVDLVENLCRHVAKQPITVGFLGSKPGVAVKVGECLQKRYPGLKVKLVASEWNETLKHTSVDILFVAFGSPKQEFWISKNLNTLPVKIAIGVGGAFDFISGKVPRAPVLMRRLGLEWLFRLLVQPWRIKRQISLIHFGWLVFREKLGGLFVNIGQQQQ